MRINILIGGRAGQGINKISQIVSQLMSSRGYFTFNYRDYPSVIRGGHNFNILSISDERIGSHETIIDGIIAMDSLTIELHKAELKKDGFIITPDEFSDLGINLNVAQAGALIKILGIENNLLIEEINKEIGTKGAVAAAEKGFNSEKQKFSLKKLNNKISMMTGSEAVAQGAINSKMDIYLAYPMTPATPVLTELAQRQLKENFLVFQPENEIAVANAGLGASFAGAKVMIGTSGGGFDLMTEALSLQGITQLPLVVYLASRPGPATGVPTYTAQCDLDLALRAGHGEFPRIVIAPGCPKESMENTNEAFYLSNKFGALSIILSDKHLAESEYSYIGEINKPLKIELKRNFPPNSKAKANSYECDETGNATDDPKIIIKNADARMKNYEEIKKECKKFTMIKIHGNKNSKNLIIGWGSTKGAILDAIAGLDFKFLQVIYLKPLSDEIKKEIQKAKNLILIENNQTGQLGRLLREKTGISIKNRILKYDGRPFTPNEIKEQLKKWQ